MSRVRTEDPQTFDFTGVDAFHDLVVGNRRLFGHEIRIDSDNVSEPFSLVFIPEISAAEEACRVGEQTGSHRVALTCDGIAPGSRLSDVACHQSKIHNTVRCPDSLISLIDAHRPPEGYLLPVVDQIDKLQNLFLRQTRMSDAPLEREGFDKFRKFFEVIRMFLDELVIDPVILDENIRNCINEIQIASRRNSVPVIRVLCRLASPRINDYDLMSGYLVLLDSAPDDRMCDDRIGTDKDNGI